ncbi:MAG: hypothetical protein IPK19_36740 [Chloroflexi bacterium]|nr:hypothetical protein [Chloroflexota bacterium]
MMDTFISAEVARTLLDIGAVGLTPEEPVTFKSGIEAPIFVDSRRLTFHPEAFKVVVHEFLTRLRAGDFEAEVVAGVETSGIPYSAVFAYAAGLPSVFVRKPIADRPSKRRIVGGEITGKRVLLVEDMISTGENSLAAIESLRQRGGALVTDCVTLVSYGFPEAIERFNAAGVRLHCLADLSTVVNEAVGVGNVTPEQAVTILRWLENPSRIQKD